MSTAQVKVLGEHERVQSEAEALEREVALWSGVKHLSRPGAMPGYRDLLAALDVVSELCKRMASNPDNTASEADYLDGAGTRIEKLISDLEDHQRAADS